LALNYTTMSLLIKFSGITVSFPSESFAKAKKWSLLNSSIKNDTSYLFRDIFDSYDGYISYKAKKIEISIPYGSGIIIEMDMNEVLIQSFIDAEIFARRSDMLRVLEELTEKKLKSNKKVSRPSVSKYWRQEFIRDSMYKQQQITILEKLYSEAIQQT
jgi:hypothetical protein